MFSRWKNEGAPRPRLYSSLPSLAQQQFAKEADINVLIDRYKKTGSFYNPLVAASTPRTPQFSDLFAVPSDMTEQLAIIQNVQSLFASLPAKVRDSFGNDPAAFVAWAQDESNFAALNKMFPGVSPGAGEAGTGGAPAAGGGDSAVAAGDKVSSRDSDKNPQSAQ